MAVIQLVFQHDPRRIVPEKPGSIRVRPACTKGDAKSIMQVAESSQSDAFQTLSPSGLLVELATRPGRSVDTWLAFVDGVPAGLAAVVTVGSGPTARHSIAWLLVARPVRRRGVGSALVASVVRDALARGVTRLWAETRADWTAAITFWRAVGFREVP